MSGAAQEAAFGVYLSWLQNDSASLGQASGRVFGQILVDVAAAATGVAVINNGRAVAQGLNQLQTAAAQRITAEIEAQAGRALQQTGGVFRGDGTAFINLFDDPALTKQHKGSMGELLGQNTVSLLLPDGLKVGRTQGIGGKGIDDLFAVSRPGVDYVIIEYKFGSSPLNRTLDGRQMSDSWLLGSNTSFNRILDSVGGDTARADAIRDALNAGRIEKWLVHVDPAGQTSVVLMDANGVKIKSPVSRVIETRPPGP
jgi:filamentous hemagglutinin